VVDAHSVQRYIDPKRAGMTKQIHVLSTGVRLRWFTLPAMLFTAACAAPTHSPPSTARTTVTAGQVVHVNPDNIRRMRGSFPAGYEISDIQGTASPVKLWGLQPDWSSDPRQCAALADPANGSASAEGLSGSGTGGIIHVVVAASPTASGPDPGTVAACDHWSMDAGRTTAVINMIDAPAIDSVPTVGMVAAVRTTVEGGNETDLRATTTIAYLGDYVAFVTVVTDPGSGQPQLPSDLASTLLTRAVATLRG
jgi:Domain of unknown function (DUF5642)